MTQNAAAGGEKILDKAVLLLSKVSDGRGQRVHEHADVLTPAVLTVLDGRGWIMWRPWCSSDSGPTLYLSRWTEGQSEGKPTNSDWHTYLTKFKGDISPEIRLSRTGKAFAEELQITNGTVSGGTEATKPLNTKRTTHKSEWTNETLNLFLVAIDTTQSQDRDVSYDDIYKLTRDELASKIGCGKGTLSKTNWWIENRRPPEKLTPIGIDVALEHQATTTAKKQAKELEQLTRDQSVDDTQHINTQM